MMSQMPNSAAGGVVPPPPMPLAGAGASGRYPVGSMVPPPPPPMQGAGMQQMPLQLGGPPAGPPFGAPMQPPLSSMGAYDQRQPPQ